MDEGFVGGNVSGASDSRVIKAPRRMRVASDLIDLLIIPALLGGLFAIPLMAASDNVRDFVLTFVYMAWVITRDAVFSPGRWMVGLKSASHAGRIKLSLPSALALLGAIVILLIVFITTGTLSALSIAVLSWLTLIALSAFFLTLSVPESRTHGNIFQAILRNFWLYPYILVIGYPIEIVSLFWKHKRVLDSASRTEIRLDHEWFAQLLRQ